MRRNGDKAEAPGFCLFSCQEQPKSWDMGYPGLQKLWYEQSLKLQFPKQRDQHTQADLATRGLPAKQE